MTALGIEDPEEDFLRYCARLSRPESYDADSPTLGLSAWELDQIRAIYESASPAAELLAERGALPYRHCEAVPDYWAELPEDKAPTGRVLVPVDARESMSDGGLNAIRTLSAAAERDGVDVRTGHRVQRVITDGDAVVGVEATTADGSTVRVGARKAVVFASGGFTHDPELRANFLSAPVYGGCAAVTNEGDLVRIAGPLGAQLRNMNNAWMCPIPLETALARDPELVGMFSVAGDSMLFVDKAGHRVVNEKLPYNELAQAFFRWDPLAGEYPNLVLVQIWDERSQRPQRERRVRAAHRRRHRRERRARHPWRDPGGARGRHPRALRARRVRHGRGRHERGLPRQPAGEHRPLQRARRPRRRRGLRPRRARRAAALQRRREGRARPHEPDDVADRGGGAVLRRARDRRHAGHEGRPEDDAPTARSSTTWTGRSPGSTASATASPRRRPAPTGPEAGRSGRSSPTPTVRPVPRTPSPSGQRRWPAHSERRSPWQSPRRR